MSWSIYSSGLRPAVEKQVTEYAGQINCSDPGEMETVKNAVVLIAQTLATFDESLLVRVAASGSMSYKDWTAKTGKWQVIDVKVEPITLST